jgi:hypothetical protein
MKAVRLTRANGLNPQVEGDAGAIRILDDLMAYEMVEVWHNAVYAPEHDPVPVREIPVVKKEPELTPEDAVQELAGLTEELGLYDEPAPVQRQMRMPWVTAPKADWINWAVYRGADAEQAAELTKNELMSRYGERL